MSFLRFTLVLVFIQNSSQDSRFSEVLITMRPLCEAYFLALFCCFLFRCEIEFVGSSSEKVALRLALFCVYQTLMGKEGLNLANSRFDQQIGFYFVTFFFTFTYLFCVYLCIYVGTCVMAFVWRSKDSFWEFVLSLPSGFQSELRSHLAASDFTA